VINNKNFLKMKTLSKTLIFLAIAMMMFACNSSIKLSNNYEANYVGQGKQGTTLMKIYSYGETVDEAIERAKMDAVHCLMFKGLPGSNLQKPLINDPSVEQTQNKYFLDFFGVDNWIDRSNTRNNRKMRYGKETAPYRSFVAISSDGSVGASDRTKLAGGAGYKVGVVVSVQHAQLRRKLEQDGIVRKFGL
jgi:hypothetical protein